MTQWKTWFCIALYVVNNALHKFLVVVVLIIFGIRLSLLTVGLVTKSCSAAWSWQVFTGRRYSSDAKVGEMWESYLFKVGLWSHNQVGKIVNEYFDVSQHTAQTFGSVK